VSALPVPIQTLPPLSLRYQVLCVSSYTSTLSSEVPPVWFEPVISLLKAVCGALASCFPLGGLAADGVITLPAAQPATSDFEDSAAAVERRIGGLGWSLSLGRTAVRLVTLGAGGGFAVLLFRIFEGGVMRSDFDAGSDNDAPRGAGPHEGGAEDRTGRLSPASVAWLRG